MLTFHECENTTLGHLDEGKLQSILLDSLRVFITHDAEGWYAQGIEIDHFADGANEDDAKKNFVNSLTSNIREHLGHYRNLEKLLVPVDAKIRVELMKQAKHMRFSGFWTAEITEETQEQQQEAVRQLIESAFDKLPANVTFFSSAPAEARQAAMA